MISVKVDPAVEARFNGLLEEMKFATGRDMQTVIRNAARDLCFAAFKHTPSAVKYENRKTKDGKFFIQTRHRYTGEVVKFAGTKHQASKYSLFKARRRIPNRGFAKAGWLAAAKKLGADVRKSVPSESGKSTAESYAVGSLSPRQAIAANMIPFIEDLDNGKNHKHTPLHILEKAIADVSDRMEKSLEKMARKAIRDVFGV